MITSIASTAKLMYESSSALMSRAYTIDTIVEAAMLNITRLDLHGSSSPEAVDLLAYAARIAGWRVEKHA